MSEARCDICGESTRLADLRTLYLNAGEAVWECRKCQAAYSEGTAGGS